MAFCGNCGQRIQDGARFCPACGAPVAAQAQQPRPNTAGYYTNANPQVETSFSPSDLKENKGMTFFAYIGPLALIPYVGLKNSPFAQFHGKQGMNLLILWAAYAVIAILLGLIQVPTVRYIFGYPVPAMGSPWWVVLIDWLLAAALIVLAVIGTLNVAAGRGKKLPLIGNWNIFK